MPKRQLSILGSTGTIGINALKLVEQFKERFDVVGLAAGRNITLLAEQIKTFRPRIVSVQDAADGEKLRQLLGDEFADIEFVDGEAGNCAVATIPTCEIVLSAIVGFAGASSTLAAINAKKIVALANKESIVAAGPVIKKALEVSGSELIPVDSEHSAIHQTMHGNVAAVCKQLSQILLTASGGPFLHTPIDQLHTVTPEQALKHPTWKMGAKISIDSSTMMNKGLEVIEATRLFDMDASKIGVVVHPQSIIHSMIEYIDGSLLAQLGVTDMRGPIAYAFGYPDRLPEALPSLKFSDIKELTFFDADLVKFPCLRLAFEAARASMSAPAVLNAANEIAVEAFLQKKIQYLDIPRLIESVLTKHTCVPLEHMQEVCEVDAWAREQTRAYIKELKTYSHV